jgi:hypothetical protein
LPKNQYLTFRLPCTDQNSGQKKAADQRFFQEFNLYIM